MVVERIGCPNNRKEFMKIMNDLKSHIIVIKCYAEWCNPCKKIKDKIEENFDRIRSTDKILMYIDVDECDDVASYLKIRALPTIISYREGLKQNIIEGIEEDKIRHFFRNIKK
jgi:thioredoxin-like negative regulator of GroEL